MNFLKLLVENGAIGDFSDCIEAYRSAYYKDNNILSVICVSAYPLTENQTEKLKGKLEAHTGKSIVLASKVEPDVIGGIRLFMDGKSYDGTIASRLKDLQKILSETVL